jgi:hypothetical protein
MFDAFAAITGEFEVDDWATAATLNTNSEVSHFCKAIPERLAEASKFLIVHPTVSAAQHTESNIKKS